jgi:hypothetical protein
MGMDLAAITDLYIVIDESEGADLDVVPEFGLGTHISLGRNLVHYVSLC